MSVYIVRAFVRLCEFALTNEKLARKVDQLEKRVSEHDAIFTKLVREIRRLIETPAPKTKEHKIVFIPPEERNPELKFTRLDKISRAASGGVFIRARGKK